MTEIPKVKDVKEGLTSTQWAIIVVAVAIISVFCKVAGDKLVTWPVVVMVVVLGGFALWLLSRTRNSPTSLHSHPLSEGLLPEWEQKYSTLRPLRAVLDTLWTAHCGTAGVNTQGAIKDAFTSTVCECSNYICVPAIDRVLEILPDEAKVTFLKFLFEHRDAWPYKSYAREFRDIFVQHQPRDRMSELFGVIAHLLDLVQPYVQEEPVAPSVPPSEVAAVATPE